MPLIDHCELEHNNKRVEQIIKIVVTIMSTIEHRVIQGWVATELVTEICFVVTMETHKALKDLHPNYGETIVQHLEKKELAN